MPAGKKLQSNTLLYTLIAFVAISIVGIALAVFFFIQTENYKDKAKTLQSQTDELATAAELRKLGTLVGDKQRQKTRIGSMLDMVDDTTTLITGQVADDLSAESKVTLAKQKAKETVSQLAKQHSDISVSDPNDAALIPVIEKLNAKLENTAKAVADGKQLLEDLQKRFSDAMQNSLEKEKALTQEKDKYLTQVTQIQQDYSDLKSLLEKSSGQQVTILTAQLEDEKAGNKQLTQNTLKAEAELKMAQDKIKRIQQSLEAAVPLPDAEVAAFKIDGRIILADEKSKMVFVNVGSDNHAYQGLTFAIYDKHTPMPKDGKGKAEIEIFSLGKNVSTARITQYDPKRPILVDDVVANLVWDGEKKNVFVVAGDFDLAGDGIIDDDGNEKISWLIEKWGGKVDEAISVDTDFLVLGSKPQTPRKPAFEEAEADAAVMEKYEASLRKISNYEEALKKAGMLSVPMFNSERFLYFIGYKSQADRPGAF